MRAVVARDGVVGVEVVDDPLPGPGQVLVEPLACGICGSDMHLVSTQAEMPDLVPPIILGHEFVGRILDNGPGGRGRFPVGSVVTSVPYLDTADGPQLIGLSPLASGGLAEQMVLEDRRLLPVSEAMIADHAALAEPLAVGAHAVAEAQMDTDDVALVIGCGPVGLAVIATLKAAGHGPVVAADFSPSRRNVAERIGADVVVDPGQQSPYRRWAELAGRELPSSPLLESDRRAHTVVFECVGLPGILAEVMNSVHAHTRIVVVGVCTEPDTVTPMIANVKELSLRFVFAYRPEEFARALEWIADGTIDVAPFITGVRTLEDAAKSFTDLRARERHCKILLKPGGEG
ncbi:zinc-binding dehydrogenase [Streptomyces sp. SID6673]|nr:zinc-binding dehydrogenase [Streptomyces sp. SID11726]NEB27098.1 zinc-binding dehydrogenase [Streptomyces sp. SID6673]